MKTFESDPLARKGSLRVDPLLLARDEEARRKAKRYHIARERLKQVEAQIQAQQRRPSSSRLPILTRRRQKLEALIKRYRPEWWATPTGLAIWLEEQLRELRPGPGKNASRNGDDGRCEEVYEAADAWYAALIDEGYPLPRELCRRSDPNLIVHLRRMMEACARWREPAAESPDLPPAQEARGESHSGDRQRQLQGEQPSTRIYKETEVVERGPYMSAEWFKSKFGISAKRLRAARRTGRLHAINVGTKRPRYHYSVPDAMRLWPDDEIYLPGEDDRAAASG